MSHLLRRVLPAQPLRSAIVARPLLSDGHASSHRINSHRARRDASHVPSALPLSSQKQRNRAYMSRARIPASPALLLDRTPPSPPTHTHHRSSTFATMAIDLAPLPLPASADPSKFTEFGREVKGVDPGNLSPEQFKEIEELLYKVRPRPSCSQYSYSLILVL